MINRTQCSQRKSIRVSVYEVKTNQEWLVRRLRAAAPMKNDSHLPSFKTCINSQIWNLLTEGEAGPYGNTVWRTFIKCIQQLPLMHVRVLFQLFYQEMELEKTDYAAGLGTSASSPTISLSRPYGIRGICGGKRCHVELPIIPIGEPQHRFLGFRSKVTPSLVKIYTPFKQKFLQTNRPCLKWSI